MAAVVGHLESQMKELLAPAWQLDNVADVRVLGSIGVIETKEPVDVGEFQRECVKRGIWVRPFGRNVYIMPPYVTPDEDLQTLCREMIDILRQK
jgi:adenosylmethionine-8-amino-7-oxononanoate aminotransferase